MKYIKIFAILTIVSIANNAHAQIVTIYPTVPELRDKLLAIVSSWKDNFNGQKINKVAKGSDEFYPSSFHIVQKDEPKIYDWADNNTYINAMQSKLKEAASADIFKKWQGLMCPALPDYDTLLAVNNTATQIKNFFCRANRDINIRLIRTQHKEGWSIVLVVCHTDKFDREAIDKAIKAKQLSPNFKEILEKGPTYNFNDLIKIDLKQMATEINLKYTLSNYTYPTADTLRKSLLNIIKAKASNFQDIKGLFLVKRNNSQYYRASVHINEGDDPQISEEPNPSESYYLNSLTTGLSDTSSQEIYNKWLNLMGQAMSEYNSTLPVKEYPEIKIHNFFSPLPDPVKIAFYRDKHTDGWRISVVVKPASRDDIKFLQISEAPAIMKESIQNLLNERGNNFASFKKNELSSNGAAIKKYAVQGILFPASQTPVEFIEEDAAGKTTFTAIITGYPAASTAIDAFETAAGLLVNKNYKLIKKEEGVRKSFTLNYKGQVIAECQFISDQLETTIRIYGN